MQELMNEDNISCAKQDVSKTEAMGQAIDGIDSVIEHLDGLLARINGSDSEPCDVKQKSPYYSLSEIMASGSETINNKCSVLHDKLNDLEKLFY